MFFDEGIEGVLNVWVRIIVKLFGGMFAVTIGANDTTLPDFTSDNF